MQTRKYPRTLNEAFGPYCTPYIDEQDTSYPRAWWAMIVVISVVSLIIIVVTA